MDYTLEMQNRHAAWQNNPSCIDEYRKEIFESYYDRTDRELLIGNATIQKFSLDDGLKYIIRDNKLVLVGVTEDFTSEVVFSVCDAVANDLHLHLDAKELILPYVKKIGESAFAYSKCTTLYAPNVEIIGQYAFLHGNLTDISIENVRYIGYSAFRDMNTYFDLNIPNVYVVRELAFKGNLKDEKTILTEIEKNSHFYDFKEEVVAGGSFVCYLYYYSPKEDRLTVDFVDGKYVSINGTCRKVYHKKGRAYIKSDGDIYWYVGKVN